MVVDVASIKQQVSEAACVYVHACAHILTVIRFEGGAVMTKVKH